MHLRVLAETQQLLPTLLVHFSVAGPGRGLQEEAPMIDDHLCVGRLLQQGLDFLGVLAEALERHEANHQSQLSSLLEHCNPSCVGHSNFAVCRPLVWVKPHPYPSWVQLRRLLEPLCRLIRLLASVCDKETLQPAWMCVHGSRDVSVVLAIIYRLHHHRTLHASIIHEFDEVLVGSTAILIQVLGEIDLHWKLGSVSCPEM
mmetsp:Transcript_10425/g.23623  ORF Transcript_10425/g.23623 Transcript_10425/m.23623 type:complete len:201 (+) Transcript_10425:488-1090(+)